MLPLTPRIDHVVVNVLTGLDEAAAQWERLGFQLTPRGHHTLGTSNNLAIFGTDYLELLGFMPGKEDTRPDLARTPAGLSGLVFKPPADPGFAAALTAAGIEAGAPRNFSRPVDLPEGPQDASFRVVDLPGAVRDGRVFFCHHDTPRLVWRPEWQAHANGVTGIAAVTIASPDPARTAAVFGRLFGAALRQDGDGMVLAAGAAEVRFVSGPAERMVALALRTSSLDSARVALQRGGVQATESQGAVVVSPEAACGVRLSFTA